MLLSSPKNEVILLEYRTPVGSAPLFLSPSGPSGRLFLHSGINIFRLQDRINTGNGCSLRILFQMEVTADKGTYFLIQKQLGALLLHLPSFMENSV